TAGERDLYLIALRVLVRLRQRLLQAFAIRVFDEDEPAGIRPEVAHEGRRRGRIVIDRRDDFVTGLDQPARCAAGTCEQIDGFRAHRGAYQVFSDVIGQQQPGGHFDVVPWAHT